MSPSQAWRVRGRDLLLHRPLVMGVLNVTPDSFSDGGSHALVDAARRRADVMLAEGADILDVGGESTRPQGARPVTVAEELRRVLPVVQAIVSAHPEAVVSVDTSKGVVAAEALAAGARIVNDVSALRLDATMGAVIAAAGAGVVLMHSRGDVSDMASYAHARYEGDVVEVVEGELAERVAVARAAGIEARCIALDPGIGFSKRPDDSLRVLAALDRIAALGFPVVVGASRKRMIGTITGVADPGARVHGSVGAAVTAYLRGAAVVRVHDVAATRQAIDVAAAIVHAGGRAATVTA
ncbi:MAG: dihydropteroate synthase [Gemmatimonadetes bacterium]|jgi:dihydropteroate synthase|nr:dihydropteroate synthase [Gemmatimonadota bacterium]